MVHRGVRYRGSDACRARRAASHLAQDACQKDSALTIADIRRVSVQLGFALPSPCVRAVVSSTGGSRRAAQQATTCSNRAPARLDGVVRGAEKARLNRSRSLAGRSDRPRQQSSQVTGGPMVRIHLPPATSQERTLRDVALGPSVLTEPEGARTSCHRLRPFDRYNCLAIIAPRADIPRC